MEGWRLACGGTGAGQYLWIFDIRGPIRELIRLHVPQACVTAAKMRIDIVEYLPSGNIIRARIITMEMALSCQNTTGTSHIEGPTYICYE